MNLNKTPLLVRTLNGFQDDETPVWLMRQAGRYLPEYRELRAKAGDFLSLCYNPEWASEVTLQPLRRFNLDAAIIFSDILVIPHALGQNLWFETGEGPKLEPIKFLSDLPDYDEQSFFNHLEPVFEALRLTRSSLSPDKALIGFAGAPWTLACYMINGGGSRDYANVRSHALNHPKEFAALLDHLVDVIAKYLIKKIDVGADAVQIFDSWSGVLSTEEFHAYSIAPTAKIVQAVKQTHPEIPIIGFPRMAGHNYAAYAAQTGINAIGCDPSVPLSATVDLQKTVCVQGNLDPLLLLKGGTVMTDQIQKICDALRGKPFIFNLGHGVIKETPPAHVELLVQTVKDCQSC
jgi:uroporphyrinogen decarboxylase